MWRWLLISLLIFGCSRTPPPARESASEEQRVAQVLEGYSSDVIARMLGAEVPIPKNLGPAYLRGKDGPGNSRREAKV
jgi:hypothetical protein